MKHFLTEQRGWAAAEDGNDSGIRSLWGICGRRALMQGCCLKTCSSLLGLPWQTTTNWAAYNNTDLFSHSSGSQKSKIQGCQQGHAPSKGSKEESFLPLPASGGPRYSLACGSITPISVSIFTSSSLCMSLCGSVLFLWGDQVTVLRAHANPVGHYLNCNCKNPISK